MKYACWVGRCDGLKSVSESEFSWTGGPWMTGDSQFSINWSLVFLFGMRGYIYFSLDFMV